MRVLSRPWALLVVALTLLAGTLVATPAHAASTGVVTGTVLKKDGALTSPYEGAYLGLARYTDDEHYDTDTEVGVSSAADGTFTFSDLEDGWYQLRIHPTPEDEDAGLGYEYYGNKWSPYDTEAIQVIGGQVTQLDDIVLEQTGWITGDVTYADGTPAANVSVGIRDGAMSGGYGVQTDAQGHYDTRLGDWTTNTIPGTYLVDTTVWDHDQAYWPAEAEVQVTAGQATVQDLVLEPRRTAIFKVLDTDGTPLVGAPLNFLFREDANAPWQSPQYGPIETDRNGEYRFTEPNEYKIQFLPPAGYTGTGVAEYWDGPDGEGSYALDDATVLTWTGDDMLRRYTVQLGAGPTIKPGAPSISGELAVGQTVTANPGSWTPSGVTFSYQWSIGGNPIEGATEREFTIPDELEGLYALSVRVTGRLNGEVAVDAVSDYLRGPVAPGDSPVEFARPTISGVPQVGNTLTADAGAWGPDGVKLTYQWFADEEPIDDATASTYQPTAADIDKAIAVEVTGQLDGYTSVSRMSEPTAPVVEIPVVVVPGTVTVTGTPKAGRTLTADPGSWSPAEAELTYQWFADEVAIDGATDSTLSVTNAHAGSRITVQVTGVVGDKTAVTTSEPTAAVVGVLTSSKPKIKGKAKVGKRLKAKPGSWGPGNVKLRYQWLRNGKVIKGATGKKYKVTKKDKRKKLQVRVTGTRGSFATVVKTSAKTKKVKK